MPEPFAALGDCAVTTDSLFDLPDLPRRLAVIGSGPIGLELAQAFARLGVEVTLFEKSGRIGGIECDRVHDAVERIMQAEMDVHLDVDATPHRTKDGARIEWSGATSGEAEFDRVLVAVGRAPELGGLGVDGIGLECDESGVPLHDRSTMRCGDSSIFLAGDVADDSPVLHEASHDGTIAGRNAAAVPVAFGVERMVPFTLTFTDPPVARIGQTDNAEALAVTADYSDQGRARVEDRNRGCVTLFADRSDGTLVGASLCAPGGEHLAHMLAWAVQRRETASDLLDLPLYHPTLEEGLEGALKRICAQTPVAISEDRDRAEPSGL
jgi:dihydrolipoamide dehydrogenase